MAQDIVNTSESGEQHLAYPRSITMRVYSADEHGLFLNFERGIAELRDLRQDVEIDATRLWIAARLKPRGGEKVYRYEYDPGALRPRRRRASTD